MAHLNISRLSNARAIWRIASTSVVLMLLCGTCLLYPAIHAHYLFRELKTLQLSFSTFADAQLLARKIGATPLGACNQSACEWYIKIGNSEIPRWWRGEGESFAVSFGVKDGVVVRKTTGYGIGIETNTFFRSSIALEEQEHWGYTRRPEPILAGWQTSELYRYYIFHVYMTPKASAADRRRFTSFNFSCFWKYHGCKDGRELLPVSASFPVAE